MHSQHTKGSNCQVKEHACKILSLAGSFWSHVGEKRGEAGASNLCVRHVNYINIIRITDHHDIADIFLKVVVSTITQPKPLYLICCLRREPLPETCRVYGFT
jgi:hypothetical protein